MTNDIIREKVLLIVDEYPVKRIVLFGSRAEETNHENSDVDLIMEFLEPISLFMLSEIKLRLEEILGLEVDIVHGPIRSGDLIKVGKEIELYVA
ncbi:MAG: nucleotidyltransferase domain-containing protein [Clostridium sp.]|nr:nucleotidyltransferase domain-containing protein [Clostridium sp.]